MVIKLLSSKTPPSPNYGWQYTRICEKGYVCVAESDRIKESVRKPLSLETKLNGCASTRAFVCRNILEGGVYNAGGEYHEGGAFT